MTLIKTRIKNDKVGNLSIHWGFKELLMVIALISAPAAGIIRTMVKADNNTNQIIEIEADVEMIENDVELNQITIAVSTNKIENVDETVKRIETKLDEFIRANGN